MTADASLGHVHRHFKDCGPIAIVYRGPGRDEATVQFNDAPSASASASASGATAHGGASVAMVRALRKDGTTIEEGAITVRPGGGERGLS